MNKIEGQQAQVQAVCSQAINLFKQLVILLKPVPPKLAADAQQFLNVPSLVWSDLGTATRRTSTQSI